MNKIINRKFIIFSISIIFIQIISLNILTFSFLKNHEKNLNRNFYNQLELLSIYWKNIFIADELETIEPGMEFSSIPIYYQNLLIQLNGNLPLKDVKLLNIQKEVLVDYNPVYKIGMKIDIDPIYWKNVFDDYERPGIYTHSSHAPPQVTVLLPLLNSLNEIKAVLYLKIQPEFLQNIQYFKHFIYFYIYFTLFLSIVFAMAVILLFIKYSKIIEEQNHKERLIQLGQLAATVAHEIRNPLGIMKGSTNILKKKSENEENKKLVNYIEEEINRLSGLINQFLQFVKVPKLESQKLDINNILEEILPKYKEKYPDINFIKQISGGNIYGDKNSLIQVLMNILNNAAQAVSNQEIEKQVIKIVNNNDKKNFILIIENNGPIIQNKTINKIFEPFFSTKEQGSGLGLPICKMLMQAMDGDILIENLTEKNGVKVSLVLRRR